MIVTYDREQPIVKIAVEEMRGSMIRSSVQVSIDRHESGIYTCSLTRMTSSPAGLQSIELGELPDVPPGQRRATWLLSDAVMVALQNPEAHSLLHW